jgi:hypothetical protein
MKKWKIIKLVTLLLLIIPVIYLIYDLIICLNMTYPHPMLGVDANNWFDQFSLDVIFFLVVFFIPILIDIILLIISCKKLRKR